MRRRAAEVDAISLSFVDVISCGLGAALFLFLLFVSLPQVGDIGLTVRADSADDIPAATVLTVHGLVGELRQVGAPEAIDPLDLGVSRVKVYRFESGLPDGLYFATPSTVAVWDEAFIAPRSTWACELGLSCRLRLSTLEGHYFLEQGDESRSDADRSYDVPGGFSVVGHYYDRGDGMDVLYFRYRAEGQHAEALGIAYTRQASATISSPAGIRSYTIDQSALTFAGDVVFTVEPGHDGLLPAHSGWQVRGP